MKNKIKRMLELIDEANTIIHPEWKTQNFGFPIAVVDECGELMDHWGYAWWKKQDRDERQAHLEAIDIFTFGISFEMQRPSETMEDTVKLIYDSILGSIESNVSESVLQITNSISAEPVYRFFYVAGFFNLLKALGLSFDDFYKLFVGKNVLNKFRQANGYKEGTYKKIWNGKEDNEALYEILEQLDPDLDNFERCVMIDLGMAYKSPETFMLRGDL